MVLRQFRLRKCYPEGIQEEQSLRMLVIRLLTFVLYLSLPTRQLQQGSFFLQLVHLSLSFCSHWSQTSINAIKAELLCRYLQQKHLLPTVFIPFLCLKTPAVLAREAEFSQTTHQAAWECLALPDLVWQSQQDTCQLHLQQPGQQPKLRANIKRLAQNWLNKD